MTQRSAIGVLQVLIVHLSSLATHVISNLFYHFVAAISMDLLRWALMVVTAILLVMTFAKILKESWTIEDALMLVLLWRLDRDELVEAGDIVVNGRLISATGWASICSTIGSIATVILAMVRFFRVLDIVVLLYDHMWMVLQRQISIHWTFITTAAQATALTLSLVNLLVIKFSHKFTTLLL